MAGFLYFVPNVRAFADVDLAELGLEPVLGGASLGHGQVEGKGPAGSPGLLLAPEPVHPDGRQPEIGYHPDKQQWWSPRARQWWLGYWTAAPPTPADLARPDPLDSYVVATPAGEWAVPIARHFDRGTALPHAVYLGDDGKAVAGAVLERFVALSAHGDRVWESFRADQGLLDDGETAPPPIDDTEAFTIVAEALAFNYRASLVEANALARAGRWLPSDALTAALRCLFDMPGWMEAEQARQAAAEKKARAGTPSG